LEVEAALALAQAELGLVPDDAAKEIAAKANLATISEKALIADIERTQAPVLSLVHTLAAACSEHAGGYLHWGATTQNIILTGQVLQVRRAHVALLSQLADSLNILADLADTEAYTVMAGRTNRQHALPITFRFKVAAWIEEFIRFDTRLREGEARLFSLVFGGAIGAMQAFSEHGPELVKRLGTKLSLNPVLVPSRTTVDHFVEYLLNLIQLGTTCGKVSKELYQLMSEEFGEASEHLNASVRGSSTLPQKVNPKLAVALIAQSAQLRGYATPTLEAG
jgi:3-carboxy-cis,cis-muconate cycloisomerase